jgi:beta-galactosidase
MASFSVRDGQFWLDGKALLLQAGEFHYFRTPADQWAQRLGLLKQAGFNAVATYIPWLWHEPQPGVVDLDGHTSPLRNLVGFLDLAAELDLWVIARPGPYIMAETRNEGIPAWLLEHFPQVRFGATEDLVSYLHPDFLDCVRRWYQGVFGVLAPRQVTRGGRVLLVQLDNEMGMLAWVRNQIDTNPDTMARFAAWWGKMTPQAVLQALSEPHHPQQGAALAAYRRFYRSYLAEYTRTLWSMAQDNGLEVPAVINIHGFGNGGKTFPIGLSQLCEVMALPDMISATDVYPLAIGEGNFHQLLLLNEMTRSLQNPHQALFSIEFQAGGNQDFGGAQTSLYDLHTRLCLSVGMRAFNHYLFCDGENDPLLSPVRRHDWGHPVRKDGSTRRHYAGYGRLSRTLAAYGEDLILAQPQTVTTIGFRLDDFATEVNLPATEELSHVLTHQREVILFDFLGRGLALTQRSFDAVELSRAVLDPKVRPTLWVMVEQELEEDVQDKLLGYAKQGGRLILVGRLGKAAVLQQALGIQSVHGGQPFVTGELTAWGVEHIPAAFIECYEGNWAEVFATCAGQVCGFVEMVGQGQVMVLGAALSVNTLEELELFDRMASRMGCLPLVTSQDWVDVRLSVGERARFLFVQNYQDLPVQTKLEQNGQPLLGGHEVRLAGRQGCILPLDWQVQPGVRVEFVTAELCGREETVEGLTLWLKEEDWVAVLALSGYRLLNERVEALGNGRWQVSGPGALRLKRE